VEGLLAYMDEDEDGVIAVSSFMRLLSRERMFQKISEEDVEDILKPMLRGDKDSDGRASGINVVALLRMLDGKEEDRDTSTALALHDDDDDDDAAEKGALATAVEYDFSPDPETRSLEKKLRSLGRALCKKGVDIEGMFRSMDLRQTGMVRRTDFVEIMSKIGLSILEKGKAMDDAQALMDGTDGGGGDARRMQIMQMKRLKGMDGGYAHNATRAARNLLMSAGESEYKTKGDFKVRTYGT
jgi:Ca2+-binding EF-hand superfamily protein